MSYDLKLVKRITGKSSSETIDLIYQLEEGEDKKTDKIRFTTKFRDSLKNTVTFEDHQQVAQIFVPYHYKGKVSKEIWTKIFEELEDLQKHLDLFIYDPQLGKELRIRKDLKKLLKEYDNVTGYVYKNKRFRKKKSFYSLELWKILALLFFLWILLGGIESLFERGFL